MGLSVRQSEIVACKQQGANQLVHPRSLISAFGIPSQETKIDNLFLLQAKF